MSSVPFVVEKAAVGSRMTDGSQFSVPDCQFPVENLPNRRNLRVCTPEQNSINAGPRGSGCGYVGVYPRGKRWEAGIAWRGKHFYLGHYDDPVEAAQARDRKAYELHGEHAYLNFPQNFGR